MASRTNQRTRTRQSILDATGALLDEGCTAPTIDDICERAGVSRATAYRYFDSAADAVWQAFADRDLPDVDAALDGIGDATDRAARAEQVVNDYLFGDPDGARAFERAVLDRRLKGTDEPDDRAGRRFPYIDAALEPIAERLSPQDLVRVRHALALTMGSQVVSALLDTSGLDEPTARDVTAFAVRAIMAEAERLAFVADRTAS
jgi:AcrR family transcriptional regulator